MAAVAAESSGRSPALAPTGDPVPDHDAVCRFDGDFLLGHPGRLFRCVVGIQSFPDAVSAAVPCRFDRSPIRVSGQRDLNEGGVIDRVIFIDRIATNAVFPLGNIPPADFTKIRIRSRKARATHDIPRLRLLPASPVDAAVLVLLGLALPQRQASAETKYPSKAVRIVVAVRCRRRCRHYGAHRCGTAWRQARGPLLRREPAWRRRHRRGSNGHFLSARWTYAGVAVERNRGQRLVVQQAAVRSAEGFRPDFKSGFL